MTNLEARLFPDGNWIEALERLAWALKKDKAGSLPLISASRSLSSNPCVSGTEFTFVVTEYFIQCVLDRVTFFLSLYSIVNKCCVMSRKGSE
jgi:hypothetical protein